MDDFEYRMEQAHDPVTGLSKEDMLLLLRRPPHGVTVADALLDLHRSGRHGAFQALFSMLLCTGMHQWRGTLFMVRDFTEEAAM